MDNWQTHECEVQTDGLELVDREWLLSNGTGAFAMGTAAGINTRRYHGLLVAATQPPVGRVVTVNQMLEQLVLIRADQRQVIDFGSLLFCDHQGGQVTSPRGHQMLGRFTRGLDVAWHYSWGGADGIAFERRLQLHWKQQAATLRYRISGLSSDLGDQFMLRLGPMITMRDFHAIRYSGDGAQFDVRMAGQDIHISCGQVKLSLGCTGGPSGAGGTGRTGVSFKGEADWWHRVHYPIERRRGQEDAEDYFLPGFFEVDLIGQTENDVELVIQLAPNSIASRAKGKASTVGPSDLDVRARHLQAIVENLASGAKDAATIDERTCRMLAMASDDFVVDRSSKRHRRCTILAGFPWFADWGRDTFIALPGVLLTTGRLNEARNTLRAFADAMCDGLVPNRFDDYDESAGHYNTVDASLWFVRAALGYLKRSEDRASWRDWLGKACLSIVDAYTHGTRFGIAMDTDGLITAGGPDTQLTWMDAAATGFDGQRVVFTPRFGKCVEINALWYDALKGVAEAMAPDDAEKSQQLDKLAAKVKRSFNAVFWNQEAGYLNDRVFESDGQWQIDASIRPNQIFAAATESCPLSAVRRKAVVDVVRQQLLTPFGLRTLAQRDPNYHGRYGGPAFERDRAYHQGTVWPWLIGPFGEAVLRSGKFSKAAKTEALKVIDPLLAFMTQQGLGQLHEIHHGAPPHDPVGCPAQAWSVAEVLRVRMLVSS